jgi:Rps23 Pro-64 3,4-dihydroxylase Tpa1-like proline 4-hydroxylase
MATAAPPRVDLAPPCVPAVRIVHLLPEDVLQFVLDVACARAPWFQPSGGAYDAGADGLQSRAVPDHRTSLVLHECPEVFPWFVEIVRGLLPLVCERLLIPPFYPSAVEAQLTAHGDGGFFRAHPDNGTYRLHRRAVSYAYYFSDARSRFVGGELVFHSDRAGGSAATLAPERNSVVFFPSGVVHEVRPVHGAPDFRASRFTINGWLSR